MSEIPEITVDDVPGTVLGSFKKAQLLGSSTLSLTKVDPEQRMQEIHVIANQAMHDVHKTQKHRTLHYAKCYVSTDGIYLYEAEKKDEKPTMKWSQSAKDIYCVVMGKRTLLTHNNMACLMMFQVAEGQKPRLPCPMQCIVFEFRHDHKNRAAAFHKACENMMKNLLSAEMSKLAVTTDGKNTEDENVDGAVTEQSNYFEVPDSGDTNNDDNGRDDDDDEDDYKYEVHNAVGKKARGSIQLSEDAGTDYLTVVVAERQDKGIGRSLSAMLAEQDDDDIDDDEL
eukprot:m.182875 g.182875  ORF g.182875 m.182875 type:complete len:283 (-) comp32136_c4_seq1:305-1153(-)